MTLKQEQFDTLIKCLESAEKQLYAYKFSVALLTVLGYNYRILILSVTLALLFGLVWLALSSPPTNAGVTKGALHAFIFLLALALVLMRSLWVSFPPPTDLTLQRKDVQRLFTFVDELLTWHQLFQNSPQTS